LGISVDELDAGGSSAWYTQIVGPQVSIYAQIPDPQIVVKVLEFLSTNTQSDEPEVRSLKIGLFGNVGVELIRDTELQGGSFARWQLRESTIRFTVPQSEVTSLKQAIHKWLRTFERKSLGL